MAVEKDPVCGMLVNSDQAMDSMEYKGHIYQFCSTVCGEKFREDPEKYAGKTAGGGELNNPPHAAA